jgi:hypothetical protein
MHRFLSIKRLSFMFFGLFAVLVAGAMTFQALTAPNVLGSST